MPLCGGRAIATRATRRIAQGEEVTNSYIWSSAVGHKRRSGLERSHGFQCVCERCTAPVGSELFEHERLQLGLVCPCGACDQDAPPRHLMLPSDPYLLAPGYKCAAPGCAECLEPSEASELLASVRSAFEALHVALTNERYEEGCRLAHSSESAAARVIGPRHELWMVG